MRAINNIPQDEYAQRLFEAMQRMRKRIRELELKEDLRYMEAKNNDNEEKALKHWFNSAALFWARQSTVSSRRANSKKGWKR